MDSLERLKETKLPPQKAFYNDITKQHLSDENYQFVQRLWKIFDLKTLRDYHDLYLGKKDKYCIV